ncbi:AP-4 complex accessory subunit Tepsin isoform X2 [Denticeps clupeoides]|uniref:AP-4 complex accessory subunit Tepsin isoform X2 n=1 Tax=Denticeps clupeoides TaxID=299321 RepID=UPI0010A2FCC4|nr:AP-4 complex accessory subunit tepsin isoform X2 [Denticeps clupeoides]
MAAFLERLAFLQKVPTLMKATADDDTPCPGYLFEEIGKISQESAGCCHCLLEYLLERLQVLKILLHLCGHAPPHLLTELRRNATFIQEAAVYSGPPDPIHGSAPYRRTRSAAQELARVLFTDAAPPQPGHSPCAAGMGSAAAARSGMQGFGFSPARKESGGGTILDRIQKAAEVVASAVLPPAEHPGLRLQDNHYRAVVAPSGAVEVAVPACAYGAAPRHRTAPRCPGQAGGGWEEVGRSSSHNSSAENADVSRTSRGGTDSQSGASREGGDLSERVEAMQLGDCGQEVALISSLTEGSKVFLSREETQRFVKRCSTLNCEVVAELLCRRAQEPLQTVQMRALCAIACLMSSDLLSLDQIFSLTHKRLVQLSDGSPGPVSNKATKLLRQLEALLGAQAQRDVPTSPTEPSSQVPGPAFADLLHSSPPPTGPLPLLGAEEGDGGRDSGRTSPGRRSLFSGMELVHRGGPWPCPDTASSHGEGRDSTETWAEPDREEGGANSQLTSAFSFLHL